VRAKYWPGSAQAVKCRTAGIYQLLVNQRAVQPVVSVLNVQRTCRTVQYQNTFSVPTDAHCYKIIKGLP